MYFNLGISQHDEIISKRKKHYITYKFIITFVVKATNTVIKITNMHATIKITSG